MIQYDLFAHNCNNFTNDFAMFLVGKGIPDHITSLPQTVLNTPFGQMLKPQLDASMRNITQAPVPPQNIPKPAASTSRVSNGAPPTTASPAKPVAVGHGSVYNTTQVQLLKDLLSAASTTCAVIFFTSSTCAPCKIAYPTYDSLAAEHPKATFIKVDINAAREIASQYQIRATPTFMTFLRGKKENEWTGANPTQLRGNVELLVQQALPQHPHTKIQAPTLQFGSLRPVTYGKVPPLDKLIAKMGAQAQNPAVAEIRSFIEHRSKEGAREAPLPDLKSVASFFRSAPDTLSPDTIFTAYDLLRCMLLDTRVSSWFVEESAPADSATLVHLLQHVVSLNASETLPYSLRLVAIQASSNLFSSPLAVKAITSSTGELSSLVMQLTISSLLAEPDRPAVRAAAASLAFNLATATYLVRREQDHEAPPESAQVELAAGLLEMLSESGAGGNAKLAPATEPLHAGLLALGYLVYYAPVDGELSDLCKVMDARATISGLTGIKELKKVASEVASCLPSTE